MFIKRSQFVLIVILIMMMLLPDVPAAASSSPYQQDVIIAYHPLTGMASFMGVPAIGHPIREAIALDKDATAEEVARSFLAVEGSQFGITDARNDLSILRETQTENGTNTVRFQQTYQGIPVLAGEIIVHMDSGKNVLSANGEILPNIDLDITPQIDEAIAIQTALQATAKENGVNIEDLQASVPKLWIYNPALLTPYKGETVLGWRIEVTPTTHLLPVRQLVLVEAKRGGVALSFNQLDHAKNRLTYNANGGNTLPGTIVCNEGNPTCSGGPADAVNAHVYAGQTYDFYMTNHGRDSIDGAGMSLISTVNYDDVPGGAPYANAFWNGTQMVYGLGFSSADDVVAHELTHGVTEYESSLYYYYQSGAINESFSDVWGEFMDLGNLTGTDTAGTRWQVGEDLPASIGVIRDMSDPTIYGDPDKMTSANYFTGAGDNGGVHSNSGVNNKAAYLMVDGANFNSKVVTGLGIPKVAKIYYYAQTNLLVSGSDYADLYYALQTSCAAQIGGTAGITSADCLEVLDAIDAVEMNLQPITGFNTDTAACGVAGETPVNSFYDDLEAGFGNWASGATTGTDRWSYDSIYGSFAHSGQHFMYADDYPAATTDTYLRMVAGVTVPPGGKLLFHHAYDLESVYDGGVLEYSTNGGSSWIDAGSLMDGNGYDATLASTNPLGSRQAFTGISHGYISTRLNLSSLAGQSVMFRFRMGVDSSIFKWGWWVDDIQLYKCAVAPSAPIVLSSMLANTNPTSAASVNFTVTFSESVTGVDVGDFNLTTTGVSGAAVSGFSGSGSIYTVNVNTGSGSGTIRLNVTDNDTIVDASSNPLGGNGLGNGDFTSGQTYTLDRTSPLVNTIVRADANPTIAASVNFNVTFLESVTGVNTGDFTLTTSGVSGAAVSGVSGSGSAYTVTVGTGSGTGTIRLDVADDDTIKDAALNPLGGSGPGNGNFTGGESYTIGGVPPAAFSKTDPINNATNQSTSPTLSWGTSSGAASYEYCYDTNNDSVCNSSWVSTSSNTSIVLSGLSINTSYYWQVRAVNIEGITYADGGTWWLFTTTPYYHWTGTTNRGHPMSFDVSASGGQWSTFKLKTDFNFGFCSGTLTKTVPGPGTISNNQFSWTGSTYAFTGSITSPTTANGTYSFTSEYIYGCGYLTQSGTWSASTPLPSPGAFGKTTPSNGAVGQSSSPSLLWGSSSNASSYEYCYDTNNNNSCDSNWVSSGINTSVALSGLAQNRTYYWQVRAVNSAGTTYADSNLWWSFTTIAAPTFADVPLNYWAYSYIERLYNAGITGGCATSPSLMYCPDSTVTRAQMAVFLLKGMHGSSYTPPAVGASTGFTDVAIDYWAAAWIKQLAAEGITGGCGAGVYCPDATVTRAQMAIFLLRAKHGSSYSPPAATGVFTDVPVGYWAAAWIEQLASEGITGGCGTGIYCPDDSVTRAQMAVFLVRTFNLP